MYSDSYRSVIRTFSPFASCSMVSNRGIRPLDTMSDTVDFGTPVRIDLFVLYYIGVILGKKIIKKLKKVGLLLWLLE